MSSLNEYQDLGKSLGNYVKVGWLYFRGQILYKDLNLKEYNNDKEEYLFA